MTYLSRTWGVDPFCDDIVSEPRQIGGTIESVNKKALSLVLAEFEKLKAQAIPRLAGVGHVVVVLSPEPGYGKSHLIGRLFRKLDDDATLIYVRAYQDPSSCWIALLERIIAELNYADDAGKVVLEPGDVTQLDVLARRILVNLVERLLKSGHVTVPEPDRALAFFSRYPNAVFETPEWRRWLEENFQKLLPALDAQLGRDGIHVVPNRSAWLRVLFKYAFSENDHELRQTCLEWLRYEPISEEDGKRLGLRLSELPTTDIPYEQRNERSFERVRELFQLAAYYRPFLVCFDQTELYTGREELARSLGVVLSRLRRETKNNLLVVTANEFKWWEPLYARFEKADQAGIAQPIHLEGLREAEAHELVSQRLLSWDVAPELRASFLAGGWLEEMFRGAKSAKGARTILREASRRWCDPTPPTPEALFEAYRKRLLADPKRLDFDPGVFELVAGEILAPAVGAEVVPVTTAKGYMTREWRMRDKAALLGFQTGSHWKTWEAIARVAFQHYETHKIRGHAVTAAFFRTPEQKPIPARAKAAIEDARCVRLVELTRREAADLYAAHDLYADVQQGNQDIDVDELTRYLREKLKPYAERLSDIAPSGSSPPDSGAEPLASLADDISLAVKALKFATLDIVLGRVSGTHAGITRERILDTCHRIPAIQVFSSPTSVVLRWIQSV